MSKKFASPLYTHGKYGKRLRETVDTDNPFLYSWGTYPTKITENDLPEDYIGIHSRSIWYMKGHLKTSGIIDMGYTYCKENHLFKDDYIYISYHEKLEPQIDKYGLWDYRNYDLYISGNDIVDIVLAAEKYSGFDTTAIRNKIEEKRIWLRDNEPDFYASFVKEDEDIFTLWTRKGYIPSRLLK